MHQPRWLRNTVGAGWTTALLAGCLHTPGSDTARSSPTIAKATEPSSSVPPPQSPYHPVALSRNVPTEIPAPAVPIEPAQFREEKAPEPTVPTGTASPAVLPVSPPKPAPDPPLVVALRAILDNQSPGDSLRQLDPASREAALTLLALAARVADGGLAKTSTAEAQVWLGHLAPLAAALRARAPLALERICFCRKIDGFGIYEPMPADPFPTFQAGSDGQPGERVQVYVEVRNFVSQPKGPVVETHLASTLEIRDMSRALVHRMDFPAVADRSLTQRQDYFINFQFRIPAGLPAGSYTLWVTVQDGANSPGAPARLARRSLDFRIQTAAVAR